MPIDPTIAGSLSDPSTISTPAVPESPASPTAPAAPIAPSAPTALPVPSQWPTSTDALANDEPKIPGTVSPRDFGRALDNNPPSGAPGSWAASVLASFSQVLSGITAPPRVPPGGGALEGISAAFAARRQQQQQAQQLQIEQQRYMDQQRQQAIENERADTRLNIEVQQAKAANASAAANLTHMQLVNKMLARADYEGGESQQKSLVDSDSKLLDGLMEQPVTPQIIKKDVSPSEIPGLLAANHISAAEHHVFATGRTPWLNDDGIQKTTADGEPLYRTTYTVIGSTPDQIKVNDEMQPAADFINRWNPQNTPIQKGQSLPGASFNDLYRQAGLNEATVRAINKARNDADIADLTEQQTADALRIAPALGNALARSGGDLRAAFNYISRDPSVVRKLPNAASAVIQAYGGPEKFQAAVSNSDKDKIEQIKAQTERLKQQNEANGGNATDVVRSLPMTPEVAAKIRTLPPSAQAILSRFSPSDQAGLINAAFGTEDATRVFPARNTRNAPGQLTLQDAFKIIPQINSDYDPTRATTYATARKDFSAGGKEAQNIKSLNTALGHMADLWNNSSFLNTNILAAPIARVFGKAGANAVDVDKNQLASELASIYKNGGAPTEQEINDQKKVISGWSDTQLRERVQEAARLAASKLGALQQQWREAAVPGAPAPFEILSPESRNALNQILKDTPQGVPSIVNQAGSVISVTNPDGSVAHFNSQADADKYRQLLQGVK